MEWFCYVIGCGVYVDRTPIICHVEAIIIYMYNTNSYLSAYTHTYTWAGTYLNTQYIVGEREREGWGWRKKQRNKERDEKERIKESNLVLCKQILKSIIRYIKNHRNFIVLSERWKNLTYFYQLSNAKVLYSVINIQNYIYNFQQCERKFRKRKEYLFC